MSGASLSTDSHCASDGTFRTHSRSRSRLAIVCPFRPRPSITVQPSAQADDIGARLGLPSEFRVLIKMTGVPMYNIFGSISIDCRVPSCASCEVPLDDFILCLCGLPV